MTFCGNRLLVEDRFRSGVLEDCLVAGCGLEGMEFRCCLWRGVELREVSAPFLVFENADMREVSIFRSSLSRMRLDSSTLRDSVLDGLVLIRSVWWELTVRNLCLRSSCLQRAEFSHVRASSSSFIDFEALESRVEDCIFCGCLFTLSFASGMNGFSGSRVRNCIFQGCRFEGFPLRGAALENCLFIHTAGEPGCESPREAKTAHCVRREEARALITLLGEQEESR
ncbi:MAG: pentapeptide repeat-containing protein [Spirochaetaceae bacterium]|nr:pentapeptide repeat-containing protein [Spirochaetaceae bacterium]